MLEVNRIVAVVAQVALILTFFARVDNTKRNVSSEISTEELKEWLGFLASDDLEGRATFTEGLGIAAQYIASHLKEWGVKPGGDQGSYFQRVAVVGVKSTNRSTVTVEANGQTRTFSDGAGINFPRHVGAKRS